MGQTSIEKWFAEPEKKSAKSRTAKPKTAKPKTVTPRVAKPSVPKVSAPKIATPKVSVPKVSAPKVAVPRPAVSRAPKQRFRYSETQPAYFKMLAYRDLYDKYVSALNEMIRKMPPIQYTYWGDNSDMFIQPYYLSDNDPKGHQGMIELNVKAKKVKDKYELIRYFAGLLGFREGTDYNIWRVNSSEWDTGTNLSLWIKPTLVLPNVKLPTKAPVLKTKRPEYKTIKGKGKIDYEDDLVACGWIPSRCGSFRTLPCRRPGCGTAWDRNSARRWRLPERRTSCRPAGPILRRTPSRSRPRRAVFSPSPPRAKRPAS